MHSSKEAEGNLKPKEAEGNLKPKEAKGSLKHSKCNLCDITLFILSNIT